MRRHTLHGRGAHGILYIYIYIYVFPNMDYVRPDIRLASSQESLTGGVLVFDYGDCHAFPRTIHSLTWSPWFHHWFLMSPKHGTVNSLGSLVYRRTGFLPCQNDYIPTNVYCEPSSRLAINRLLHPGWTCRPFSRFYAISTAFPDVSSPWPKTSCLVYGVLEPSYVP